MCIMLVACSLQPIRLGSESGFRIWGGVMLFVWDGIQYRKFDSDVNKDWTCKDKDKDKDQAYKDQDKDKD